MENCRLQKSAAEDTISYFGMQAFTETSLRGDETFQPDQLRRNLFEIIEEMSNTGANLITESCKTFDKVNYQGPAGLEKMNNFFSYLKKIYDTKKNTDITKIEDCQSCVDEINQIVSSGATSNTLKRALTKGSYEKFLYSLFFKDCKKAAFPANFIPFGYPYDSKNATPADVKKIIINELKTGRPVLFTALCVSENVGYDCKDSHVLVISGYKQVVHPKDKKIIKDVFKLHNSWGEDWQRINNNGWVNADDFVNNTLREKLNDGKSRIVSGTVISFLDI